MMQAPTYRQRATPEMVLVDRREGQWRSWHEFLLLCALGLIPLGSEEEESEAEAAPFRLDVRQFERVNARARGKGIRVNSDIWTRTLVCVAFGLVATQAEARFLQADPVGYDDQINLYAYVGNDPMNAIDPNGTDAWLISRPTPYVGQRHMFVVVADKLGGKPTAIFSYGPSGTVGQSLTGNSNLVSLTGTGTKTAIEDNAAWMATSSPQRSELANVSTARIGAEDSTVLAAGSAVDKATGTLKNPGDVTYSPQPGLTGGANSNSAAYAIANGAVTSEGGRPGSQALPSGGALPGAGQSQRVVNEIPRTSCGKMVCND